MAMGMAKTSEKHMAATPQATGTAVLPTVLGTANVQFLEFVLFSSILERDKELLIERLKGISDPGFATFEEHEMSFALSKLVGGAAAFEGRKILQKHPKAKLLLR